MRRTVRWLLDYRNGLTLIASVLVALLAIVVFDSIASRDRALDAAKAALASRDQTGSSATRRIDLLTAQIADLQHQLQDGQATAAEQRGEMVAEVSALAEQVRQLGGRPVAQGATSPTTTAPAGRSGATATTTTTVPVPRPAAPPGGPPPPSTTTTTTCAAAVLGRCIAP